MSTHWAFYCRSCGIGPNYDVGFNHGEETLNDLYQCKNQLAIIDRVSRVLELGVFGEQSGPEMIGFLVRHVSHDLCIKNEYGEIEELKSGDQQIKSIELNKPDHERVIYQLIGRDKFKSPIEEVERGQPSIRASIMIPSNPRTRPGYYGGETICDQSIPDPARRFYMTKRESAIFITYEEK